MGTMGSYPTFAGNSEFPALTIRPVEGPLDQYAKVMQIKAGFLGQQLQAAELKGRNLENQQRSMTIEGQRGIIQAQHDPSWDATDIAKTQKLFDKYGVPQTARTPFYQSIKDYNDLVKQNTTETMQLAQQSHNRLDDLFQAARNAPKGKEQETYDQAKQMAVQYAQQLPSPHKEAILSEIRQAPAAYNPDFLDQEHAILRTSQDLNEAALKKAQAVEAQGKGALSAGEAANLPTPQQAGAQRAATLQETQQRTSQMGQVTPKDIYVQNQENIRSSNQRQATFANQLQFNALKDVNTMAADPQHGFGSFAAQAQLTKSTILASKNGSELASNLEPLMMALGVTSFAQVHRINATEVGAAGPQVGSAFRQFNAILDKYGSGKVPAASLKEASDLVDGMIAAKHASLVTQADTVISNANNNSGPKQPRLDKKNIVISTPDGRGTMSLADALAGKGGGNTQGGQPAGATMKVPGSDGKLHWSDGKRDLGIAQ